MKSVFMFSGQGSQYVGMCQELFENFDSVKELFKTASEVLGFNVEEVLFGDEEKLNNTLYTQPLMFVMYASVLQVLEEKGITSDTSIGLSLGEYGALYHNDVFDFQTGLKLLQKRGLYMSEACATATGKMSAILGMDATVLQSIIESVDGYVKIANYNTYGQLVISGEETAVLQVNERALEQGAKRAIPLNTSGPFHTDLMIEAKEKFANYLETLTLHEPSKTLLVNTTGDYYQGGIKEEMATQITTSVLFYQMIETLLEDDYDTFIEIGPKTTLCSFVKKINRKLNILNVENMESLEKTLRILEV